jgi:propanol-preferring alcohol dehydrogenase
MKAMVLARKGPVTLDSLVLRDIPLPSPRSGEVLIRVLSFGVCRTDLHVVEGDLPGVAPGTIPGHEIVGEIAGIGEGVTGWNIGDPVGMAWLYSSCGSCRFCLSGKENLCLSPMFTGYDRPGGFAEYVVGDGRFVYHLPPGGDPSLSAPLLCAGIIGYRAFTRLNLHNEQHLGLYGFGASAHLVLQMAKSSGMKVSVISRGEGHQALAREMGADFVGPSGSHPKEPLDGAILFAPAGDIVPDIMLDLDRGGRLLIAGIHLSDIPSLVYQDQLFLEKSLGSVTANTREDGMGLLKIAEEFGIVPKIRKYPLQDAGQALMDLKNDQIRGAAVLTVAE